MLHWVFLVCNPVRSFFFFSAGLCSKPKVICAFLSFLSIFFIKIKLFGPEKLLHTTVKVKVTKSMASPIYPSGLLFFL